MSVKRLAAAALLALVELARAGYGGMGGPAEGGSGGASGTTGLIAIVVMAACAYGFYRYISRAENEMAAGVKVMLGIGAFVLFGGALKACS